LAHKKHSFLLFKYDAPKGENPNHRKNCTLALEILPSSTQQPRGQQRQPRSLKEPTHKTRNPNASPFSLHFIPSFLKRLSTPPTSQSTFQSTSRHDLARWQWHVLSMSYHLWNLTLWTPTQFSFPLSLLWMALYIHVPNHISIHVQLWHGEMTMTCPIHVIICETSQYQLNPIFISSSTFGNGSLTPKS
jgi:hypothetical protein